MKFMDDRILCYIYKLDNWQLWPTSLKGTDSGKHVRILPQTLILPLAPTPNKSDIQIPPLIFFSSIILLHALPALWSL